jgi:predicted RNA-binding Zn ribbon-like protein
MVEPSFDLNSDDLCLNFANSWGGRLEASTDPAGDYSELVAWAVQGGIIAPSQAHQLLERAGREPANAAASVERAVRLRKAIYESFARVAGGRLPLQGVLDEINRTLADAIPHLRLRVVGSSCRWEWSAPQDALNQMLWAVALSAAELLTSDRVDRVRECASETCSWLFLDGSRNRRRKWCDMASCGNRAKARRYYDRHHRG